VSGYEIHAGISEGPACSRPALLLDHGEDGAISDDGQVLGTYLHGIFDRAAACDALLVWAGLVAAKSQDIRTLREASIERLADTVVEHLDTAKLMQILEQSPSP
jgi:adenosylcobyric acid synthase